MSQQTELKSHGQLNVKVLGGSMLAQRPFPKASILPVFLQLVARLILPRLKPGGTFPAQTKLRKQTKRKCRLLYLDILGRKKEVGTAQMSYSE